MDDGSPAAYKPWRDADMSMQADVVQYTIRGVPREVDRILRKKAEERKLSLNQVVLEELARATVGNTRRASFSDLVGQWTADPGFEDVMASLRRVDPEEPTL